MARGHCQHFGITPSPLGQAAFLLIPLFWELCLDWILNYEINAGSAYVSSASSHVFYSAERERNHTINAEYAHLPAPYILIIHLNANLLHVSWLPLIFFMPTSRIHLLCRSAASSWSSSLFCNQHSIRDSGCVSVKVTVYCLMTRLKTGIWSASETGSRKQETISSVRLHLAIAVLLTEC